MRMFSGCLEDMLHSIHCQDSSYAHHYRVTMNEGLPQPMKGNSGLGRRAILSRYYTSMILNPIRAYENIHDDQLITITKLIKIIFSLFILFFFLLLNSNPVFLKILQILDISWLFPLHFPLLYHRHLLFDYYSLGNCPYPIDFYILPHNNLLQYSPLLQYLPL